MNNLEEIKAIAKKIAKYASDKKAQDIILLNMEGLSSVTDYFIIASARNTQLVKAIADNIEKELFANEGITATNKEGYREGRWILMDFDSIVVHIFLEEERNFYNLEELWAQAPSEEYVEKEEE
jgi:ribosome-associated protein